MFVKKLLLLNASAFSIYMYGRKTNFCEEHAKKEKEKFTLEQIKKSDRFLTVYKDKVYDLTEFEEMHPGGKIIRMARNGYLDPHFKKYSFHQHPSIVTLLDEYEVGFIDQEHVYKFAPTTEQNKINNQTNEKLRVISHTPFNAESKVDKLNSYLTDQEDFFVRNHMPAPTIDKNKYKLKVCVDKGVVDGIQKETCQEYSYTDLFEGDKFSQKVVTSVIQCAGNRRSEMNVNGRNVSGLQWTGGAIGNAEWTGVPVRDIFTDAFDNFNEIDKKSSSLHLTSRGYDAEEHVEEDGHVVNYETSVTLDKALDQDTILAYKMNGQDLNTNHGHPARLIVPGYCGARNVKWLAKMTVTTDESNSRWQKHDYKVFPSNYSKFENEAAMNQVLDTLPPIHSTPVTSYVCSVEKVDDEHYVASGYAYSGNGVGIKQVNCSTDNGKTWHNASLSSSCTNSMRCWGWTIFEYKFKPEDNQDVSVMCEAIDYSHNRQPENVDQLYNLRGLLNNSVHRVEVN